MFVPFASDKGKEFVAAFVREEEENNVPQMKPLFFLYVWLNLTHIAELQPVPYLIRDKEDLVKEIK